MATCLLGLAVLAACRPSTDEPSRWPDPEWTGAPQAVETAEVWTPSAEWLELYQWDQEVAALRQEALRTEDRDEQLALYDEYKAAEQELEDYFIENPAADAPCDTRIRYAPPELWCSAQQQELELLFNVT